ncbi:hypothetical protein FQN54_009387 [Arachnomyces sp. PD_36]|nr:hypothetical protein FQN54_009387 [Arachnomyces sp. PD_36]
MEKEDYVVTDRDGIVENRHKVHAAITDASGLLSFAVGDPMRMTLARSVAKPVQALAILETGAFEKFGLDDADLALVCGSHNSEDRHISRARAMLDKIQSKEEDMKCGGHPALLDSVNRAWAKKDYYPTALCSNCSGKHVGMLAGAKAIDADTADYHLPTHPMQLQVKKAVEELSGLETENVHWAVDGCGLIAPALPLLYIAKIFASMASAADSVARGMAESERTHALARVYHAMAKYPEMVGGEGRFCTRLMEVYKGVVIGKLGAEGCYGIGIRSRNTQPVTHNVPSEIDDSLGIAVKIEDGNIGVLYTAVVEILRQRQIGTPEQLQELADFHRPSIVNTRGVVTGHTYPSFYLRPQ